MGRRHRYRQRWHDERDGRGVDDVAAALIDTVEAVSGAVADGADPVARERRRQEKAERQHRRRQEKRRAMIAAGAGLLAGGSAASLGLLTVAAVGLGLLVGAATAAALRWWGERPRPPVVMRPARPVLRDPTIAGQDARTQLVRSVVSEAMAHLRTVDRVAATIDDLEIAAMLTRIAAVGGRVCALVAAQPALFDKAQRLLTYHAERAAKLATMAPDAAGERRDGVRRVLARMEQLFDETEAALKHQDGRDLDLELKLIDQALDEDLRR